MRYHLGVDLGTTATAAAVAREDGRLAMATLGDTSHVVPSVAVLREDGEWLVGEAAARRALEDPSRVAREVKRRIGDPVPVVVGGVSLAAELVVARVLRWVVDRAASAEGEWPASVAVTHPAGWGPFKVDLLRSAAGSVGVEVARWVPEPVAAATAYAAERPLPLGALLAVYDLGGGTFDACVVRRDEGGFTIVGRPEGIERLGGVDVDEAVFAHVRRTIGDAVDALDPERPDDRTALAALRRECRAAKEALSSDHDASIPVLLPSVQTSVRLTRGELEGMVRPVLDHTIEVLRRTIASAGAGPEHLHAVLLVGGASRMPLVGQVVAAELGRPVAADAHPKDLVALGAARLARDDATGAAVPVVVPPPPPPPATAPTPVPLAAAPVAARPSRAKWWAIAAAVVLVLAAALALPSVLDDGDETAGTGRTTTTEEAEPDETTTTDTEPTTDTTTSAGAFAGIDDYSPEAEQIFVDACVRGGGEAVADPCRCVYGRYEAEPVPFEEFVADAERDPTVDGFAPRMDQFLTECVAQS